MVTPASAPLPANVYVDSPPQESSNEISWSWVLYEIPVESLGFFSAAALAHFLMKKWVAPLLGVGLGLLATRLVIKAFDRYDSRPLVNLTKEACKLNRKYPKLQLITFIFALAISFLWPFVGLAVGTLLGAFGAVILDVENYKLILQANRKDKRLKLAAKK